MYMCSKRMGTYVRICKSNSLLIPAITTMFSISDLSPHTMFNVYVLSQHLSSVPSMPKACKSLSELGKRMGLRISMNF